MKESPPVFKAGTRSSHLALIQSRGALDQLAQLFPQIRWEQVGLSSPGDRDRQTDLRESPGDFFSRDLDEAVLKGELDCAVHSAKDLVYPLRDELDWFWLPWAEDPSDVLVCRKGEFPGTLPPGSLIGVSSERRESYCRSFFPGLRQEPIRGNIEERLAQLDQGKFDMIVMAAAALKRLGLEDRISQRISPEDLSVPDGQGVLALTYRKGDRRFDRIRSFFIKPVFFVGSGPGSASLCTLRGTELLKQCDICLYDSLIGPDLLRYVRGEAVYTGKRSGRHSFSQETISAMISEYARRGKTVVRLKGGDPGIFGRLAEEVEELESLGLPYEVVPGVSSLNAATGTTGMLLTRRGVSRGYTAMSARVKDGGIADTGPHSRLKLPVVYFMSLKASPAVLRSLIDEGRNPGEPAAVVYNAGSPEQEVLKGTLESLPEKIAASGNTGPGLLIAGEAASYRFRNRTGALGGMKVLLTCSAGIGKEAVPLVIQKGGVPVVRELIRLERTLNRVDPEQYDWVVLTSPAAVRFLMEILQEQETDFRRLPKIMVCGEASASTLWTYGIRADLCPPSSFGADELIRSAGTVLRKDDRVLRLRSEKAGTRVTEALRACGAEVEDRVLYKNTFCPAGDCPDFDAVYFASSSAVESFLEQWGGEPLQGKILLTIGRPTGNTLEQKGFSDYITALEATTADAVDRLALFCIRKDLEAHI